MLQSVRRTSLSLHIRVLFLESYKNLRSALIKKKEAKWPVHWYHRAILSQLIWVRGSDDTLRHVGFNHSTMNLCSLAQWIINSAWLDQAHALIRHNRLTVSAGVTSSSCCDRQQSGSSRCLWLAEPDSQRNDDNRNYAFWIPPDMGCHLWDLTLSCPTNHTASLIK